MIFKQHGPTMTDEVNSDKNAKRIDEIMNAVRLRYIKSPRDHQLREMFDWLIARGNLRVMPNQTGDGKRRVEGRVVAVPGQSGAGKTTAIERMLAQHPDLPDFGKPSCPVISVTTPGSCTLKTLGRAILWRLGYPLQVDRKEHEVWEMVQIRLTTLGTKLIYIDELQNVTKDAKKNEAPRIRNTLKSLLNNQENPICLLLSGTPEIQQFIEEDTQIRRRTRFVLFRSFCESDTAAIKGTVKTLVETSGLTVDFRGQLAQRLLHAGLDELGTAIEISIEAIEIALQSSATIATREHFAIAYARRTQNAAPANPFVANNWRAIDCRRVGMTNPNERDPKNDPKPTRRRRKN